MSLDDTTDDDTTSAADEAAQEAAFNAGFENEGQTAAPVEESTPAVAEPAVVAAEVEPPVDPYASLPPEVKTALAAIPALETELRRTQGRVAALQSAEDKRSKTAAPAPVEAEHRSQAREAVENDMPEVAEFVREELARVTKAQATATETIQPAEQQVSPEEVTLNEEYPSWGQTLASTEFNAWLATQAPEYREKVTKTDKAAVVMRALTQFDSVREASVRAANEAQRLANLRRERAAGSVAPRGQGSRPASTTHLTEDEAFEQGFKTG